MARVHIESVVRRLRTEFHEHEVLLPDGKIGWQEWINHVIRDTRGNVVELQGIGRDITERRRVENALRETRSELERVTRVTALGELAASIAHEVNQPLAAIAANANACVRLLDQGTGDIAEVRKALPDIVPTPTGRAPSFAERVICAARRRPSGATSTSTRSSATCWRLCGNAWNSTGCDCAALSVDPPVVQGGAVQIEQVLLNLVLNAVDAVENVDGRAISRSWRENGQVCVSVRDSGVGFLATRWIGCSRPSTRPSGKASVWASRSAVRSSRRMAGA
jgi:C4-dicarboxylate-specific signal transduction histidine kinase